MQTIAIFEAPV